MKELIQAIKELTQLLKEQEIRRAVIIEAEAKGNTLIVQAIENSPWPLF